MTLQVFTPKFGALNTVCWIGDFEDLAALDKWQQALSRDEEYRKMATEANELFVESSIIDTVLTSV